MKNYFHDITNHPKRIFNLSVIALIVLFILGLVVFLLGEAVFGIVLMAAGICCVILALTVFWRCPRCDEFLPFSHLVGRKACPYCGKEID